MSTLTRLLSPLRQAAAALFKHDVTVRAEDGHVRVVLQERKAPRARSGRSRTKDEAIERKLKEELTQIRVELAALLNELPETRTTMRHLVFVEQALAKKGLKVLHKIPLDVLQRALEQLENLVTNWSPVGLANLRSKMAVAVIDREHMDPVDEGDAYRTAAMLDAVRSDDLKPVAPVRGDDEALAAAYAALGNLAPAPAAEVQMQGELASNSARTLLRNQHPTTDPATEISIRVLQP